MQGGDRGDHLVLGADAGPGELGGDVLGDVLGLPAAAGQPAGLGDRVENSHGQRVRRIRVGPQGGRVELTQDLAERDRGRVPPGEHGHVRGQDRLVADQLARGGQVHRGDRPGLQGAGQPDRAAGGGRGGDLLR